VSTFIVIDFNIYYSIYINLFALDEQSAINAKDTFVKKPDIKAVKNKIDQVKIAKVIKIQNFILFKIPIKNNNLPTTTTTLQIYSDDTGKQDTVESKTILKIKSQQRDKQAQENTEGDEVICEDKPTFDPKKYCVYCQKAVTNMPNHCKGTKHLENVYNSQIIYEKELISLK
jgi:hypothetical protein